MVVPYYSEPCGGVHINEDIRRFYVEDGALIDSKEDKLPLRDQNTVHSARCSKKRSADGTAKVKGKCSACYTLSERISKKARKMKKRVESRTLMDIPSFSLCYPSTSISSC